MMKNVTLSALLIMAVIFAGSCSKDDDKNPSPEPTPQTVTVIKDLPADPVVEDPDGGRPSGGTGEFTLFRFSDSSIVEISDSAAGKWDIGFQGTTVILNSNIHGSGNVTGQVVKNTLFEDLTTIPGGSFLSDSTSGNVFDGWYEYNMENHTINPNPGFLLVIQTHDDKYVKVKIVSYYKGAPEENLSDAPSRYYTFKYLFLSEENEQ